MKINYLRNPLEDKAISMVQYIDDLINYQKIKRFGNFRLYAKI